MVISRVFSKRSTQVACSLVCLYSFFLLLNSKTLLWPFGLIDSPTILAQLLLYSPAEYFASPTKYQFLTFGNLTPWVTLSWGFDYAFFQLDTLGYRVHQLISAAVLLGIVYLLIYRLTRSVLNAGLFCFAIFTMPATFEVIDDLACRHYLEGMIFCLLSLLAADNYMRTKNIAWLAASVLLYCLSLTAKEIYIPLPAVLFFRFPGGLLQRIRFITPYAIALLAYLAWRIYMLSGIGGYSAPDDAQYLPQDSLMYFYIAQKTALLLFATPTSSLLMLALFALLLATNFSSMTLSTKFGILVGAAGVMLPLLALTLVLSVGIFSPRWLFALSMALLLCLAYLCSITESWMLRTLVYVTVLSCSLVASHARTQETPAYDARADILYKPILQSDPNRFVLIPRPFSQYVAQSLPTWAYIAKLRNGSWGTLPVVDIGQLQYHETQHKKSIWLGESGKQPNLRNESPIEHIDLIKSSNYNAETGLVTLNFIDGLTHKKCFVYFFGKHNGLLLETTQCNQWNMYYGWLSYLTRMTGYDVRDMSVAVWTKGLNHRKYSKVYKVRQLIDVDSL